MITPPEGTIIEFQSVVPSIQYFIGWSCGFSDESNVLIVAFERRSERYLPKRYAECWRYPGETAWHK